MTRETDNQTDVLIVGGGLIGLAVARELRKKGVEKIVVLERGTPGAEASQAAAGMLAPHAETDRADDFFRLCRDSNELYDEFAAALSDETGIDVGLDPQGTLYLALTAEDAAELGRRYEWQRAAGLAVERLTARETRALEPFVSPDVRESLFFPHDRQIENRRLTAALERFAATRGIDVRPHTEVREILIEDGRCTGAATGDGARLKARVVVLAAGAWSSLVTAGDLALPPVRPVRGQMLAFQTAKRLFGKVIYSPRGYLVPRADGRILVGATVEDAGFDKSVTAAGIARLRAQAVEIAPSLVNLEPVERWAGLRPRAADGHPIIGSFPQVENFFVATAHYRNGILLAPLTAKLLAARIADGVESEYLRVFGPDRFARPGLRLVNTTV